MLCHCYKCIRIKFHCYTFNKVPSGEHKHLTGSWESPRKSRHRGGKPQVLLP